LETENIYNFRKVNDQISTAGQPSEEQLRSAAAEGYEVIINLATFHPGHSLPDEADLVRSLGMAYYHIPVVWDRPLESDFTAFEQVMEQVGERKMLIHCAANFRVTVFYSLYAMKNLGWRRQKAREFRDSIWQGSRYPVWETFIQALEAEIEKKYE
jgi:protein tyrosine phosphatase (PTP) superfamily phosphohydrolase (DUF442 family)